MKLVDNLFPRPENICDAACRAEAIRERALDAAILSGRPRL